MNIDEPLEYLSRAELQLKFMQNLEREILKCGKNSKIRRDWDFKINWSRVQTYLNGGTCKAGSTSSTGQCIYIGAKPNGKTFFNEGLI